LYFRYDYKSFRGKKLQKRIIFRLPDKTYEQIKKLVESGKFKSISEVVREALKEFLSKQLGEVREYGLH